MSNMSAANDLNLARGFAEELGRELGANLVRLSIFGSRARRDHDYESDFDLVVVLRNPTGAVRSTIHQRALGWEISRGVDLSTKILGEADFLRLSQGSDRFWQEFRRDEQVLWPTS